MVSKNIVDMQLKAIGYNYQAWGRAEARELKNILVPYEEISECLNGHYENGFAMLCSTNLRIILVDRKPMYLTIEDVRYDMISEIDYGYRLLNASVTVFTPTKSLSFTSWNQQRLRKLASLAQQRVMEIRQYHQSASSNAIDQALDQQPQYQQQNFNHLPQLVPITETPSHNHTAAYDANQLQTPVVPMGGLQLPKVDSLGNSVPNFPVNNTGPVNAINPFSRIALTTKRTSPGFRR